MDGWLRWTNEVLLLSSQQKSQGSGEARHDAAGYDSVPETYEAYEAGFAFLLLVAYIG